MRAVVVQTENILKPLGDPARDAPVLNRPLHEAQAAVFEELGWTFERAPSLSKIKPGPPCLAVEDNLFFTRDLIREFMKQAVRRKTPVRLAVPASPQWSAIAGMQEVEARNGHLIYPVHYLPSGGKVKGEKEGRPAVVETSSRLYYAHRWAALPGAPQDEEFILTTRSILQVLSPAHVYLVNFLANANRILDWFQRPIHKQIAAFMQGGRDLNVGSLISFPFNSGQVRKEIRGPARGNFHAALGRINRVGRNCDIHPTAFVEGCWLGDGVKVGANAVLRFSVLGEGVEVGDCGSVLFSAVGDRAQLLGRCETVLSVIYPEAALMDCSFRNGVAGRRSVLMSASPADSRMDGRPVRVPHRGGEAELGVPFFSAAVGHGARLGPGAVLKAGTFVENGARTPD